ncbi:MAG: tetratricopeptide repeat protein [Planctomycetes bacterium]|nr:tetratricopeptide repeat protein [Planctomycetota bacterium]
MSTAVVFAYAVEDGLTPVVGAAPFDVLARQIPRILVTHLNGEQDRGVRFFPFLGPVDGARGFLRLRELLEPKALVALHQQGDVELLVDGLLRADQLVWRVLDGAGNERLKLELPFDPLQPLAVLPRLEFELVSLLGWTGRVRADVGLEGEALGWFLVLKDELLRREANLPEASAQPLRAAERCVELGGDDAEVQQLVVDFLALLLRRGQHRDAVPQVAAALAPRVVDAARLDRLAGITFAAGDASGATAMVVRAAGMRPDDAELAERAAAMAFQVGDDAAVRRVVDGARSAGAVTPKLVAQLAASLDRTGDVAGRNELVDELVGHDELPVPVARLVVSFLLEEEQPALARTVVERALAAAPDQAMLHYELGRACLLLDDTARASVALQRAIELGVAARLLPQARRLLRLSLVPGLWHGTSLVEKAIAAGDLDAALGAVRALVRRAGTAAEAWLMFGIVQHKRGKLRRAERLLRVAVRLYDECAEAHNRLGIVLLQTGRVDEGDNHLRRANELSPDDTSTLLHLAQSCAMRGDREQAEQQISRAEQLGADPALIEAVRREIRAA